MSNSQKLFKRCKEDFVCANCGKEICGDGYTNHCPACLWSKHVDVNPGDRAATCGGLMKPVSLDKKGQQLMILHCCEQCGFERRNKTAKNDDFEAVIEISTTQIPH